MDIAHRIFSCIHSTDYIRSDLSQRHTFQCHRMFIMTDEYISIYENIYRRIHSLKVVLTLVVGLKIQNAVTNNFSAMGDSFLMSTIALGKHRSDNDHRTILDTFIRWLNECYAVDVLQT
jgi:hypothetical protein